MSDESTDICSQQAMPSHLHFISYLLQEGLWFSLPEQLASSQLWCVQWEKSHPHELKQPAKQVNKASSIKTSPAYSQASQAITTTIIQLWRPVKECMHFFRIRHPWLGRQKRSRRQNSCGKCRSHSCPSVFSFHQAGLSAYVFCHVWVPVTSAE